MLRNALLVMSCAALLAACGPSGNTTTTVTKTVTETVAATVTVATTATQPTTTTGTTTTSPPPGQLGTIVPFQSIGDVTLGTKKSAVIAAIGAPDSEKKDVTELGSYITLTYQAMVVHLRGTDMKVIQIDTTDPGYQTTSGIGVGSTQAQVTSAYPKASCDTGGYPRICRLDDLKGTLTDFRIGSSGKVISVTVGYLGD